MKEQILTEYAGYMYACYGPMWMFKLGDTQKRESKRAFLSGMLIANQLAIMPSRDLVTIIRELLQEEGLV